MAESRLKDYKNKGLDAEELRRRREEEGVQIRKSKRDDEVPRTPFRRRYGEKCTRRLSFSSQSAEISAKCPTMQRRPTRRAENT